MLFPFPVRSVVHSFFVAAFIATISPAVENQGETKVVSHVFNGYARTRLPDGTYQPETYVFAYGGLLDDEPMAGDKISELRFEELAGLIAPALRAQNYLPSQPAVAPSQLIVLWYGTTKRTVDKPAGYEVIEKQNQAILGFQQANAKADSLYFTSMARDFYDEFRAGRYFVVLKAYDFETARRENRMKPLWETRFSIQRQAVRLEEELPAMAEFASRTFGHETHSIFNPDTIKGTVRIDELKVLGEAPASSSAKPAP
jgi:hypothetical protein